MSELTPAELARQIVGTWELFLREDRLADGTPHPDTALGPDPAGLLVYDAAGHFAAQFMKRDRSGADGVSPTISGKNNSRAIGGYDAYWGRYHVIMRRLL